MCQALSKLNMYVYIYIYEEHFSKIQSTNFAFKFETDFFWNGASDILKKSSSFEVLTPFTKKQYKFLLN